MNQEKIEQLITDMELKTSRTLDQRILNTASAALLEATHTSVWHTIAHNKWARFGVSAAAVFTIALVSLAIFTDSDTTKPYDNEFASNITQKGEPIIPLEPLNIEYPTPVPVSTPPDLRAFTNLEHPSDEALPEFLAPVGTINVAKYKPVTSSARYPTLGDISMITDGIKSGSDTTYVELAPSSQHVTIDLETKHDVYAVAVWHYHKNPRVYKDVVVQLSNDPEFMEGVTTIFNNDIDGSSDHGLGVDLCYVETNQGKLLDAKGESARYVRLWSNGNSENDFNHYVEVEVFSQPNESDYLDDVPMKTRHQGYEFRGTPGVNNRYNTPAPR